MILHRIVAANVGPFVGTPVVVGPFTPGLNILSAPNETGKTMLLKAAGRALFDRHTCKADEIRNLRPAGTALAPAITVELETQAGRFRIEKTFLQSPRSQLSEQDGTGWRPVADGDSADDRLNALLQSTKPGRGATEAAHWGMLGYLWMRQGELAEWPEWQRGPAGQLVQGMLVKVELDPFIQAVRDRMWTVFTENFTPSTNQPKVGGLLLLAEEELARVETELAGIARTREQLQVDQDQFERLSGELPRLEAEFKGLRQQADALREAMAQARVGQVEVEKCRHVLTTARDRLKTVQQEDGALRDDTRRAEGTKAKLHTAREESARRVRESRAAQESLRSAEAAQEENARQLAAAQAEFTRASQLGRHLRLSADILRAEQALERGAAHAATLERLTAERGEIPPILPTKLARLEKLSELIQANRFRLEALGLTVELTPTRPVPPITVRADDEPAKILPAIASKETQVVHAAQTLTLELPGWGTLRLRSGAGEVGAAREKLAAADAALRQELAALGVSTLGAARERSECARDLDRQITAARQALTAATGQAGETPDGVRVRIARDRLQLELLTGEIGLPPAEIAGRAADAETLEQTATVRCEGRRAEAAILDRKIKECRETAAAAARAQETAERVVLLLRADAENLEKSVATLQGRYSGGLENEISTVSENAALAKLALQAAEGKLPPETNTLPERNRRAAAAAEQVSVALGRTRAALAELRGRLELQGSSGLHGRENTLAIHRAALRVQVTQARSRSRAARLVHDLIERRQQAATRAVLAPLQERLSARFAEVSGDRDRRIFLDESLTVRGLGRKDGELVPFGELSQGAKEQLLLCLRLAIAEELVAAGGGPQSLILDDVLVNTDAARQERVLTLLSNAAHGLQILVCTCHPDRYRGVGEVVALRRE